MEELKEHIEPDRFNFLSRMIQFNNSYAGHLLKSEKFKEIISFSKNHLFWGKDNQLRETKDICIYAINPGKWEHILADEYLKPLLISYLSIKAVLHNDKKIFEKWELSFETISEELTRSLENLKTFPEEERKKLENLIGEIKNADDET